MGSTFICNPHSVVAAGSSSNVCRNRNTRGPTQTSTRHRPKASPNAAKSQTVWRWESRFIKRRGKQDLHGSAGLLAEFVAIGLRVRILRRCSITLLVAAWFQIVI